MVMKSFLIFVFYLYLPILNNVNNKWKKYTKPHLNHNIAFILLFLREIQNQKSEVLKKLSPMVNWFQC